MITGQIEQPLFESVDALKEFLAAQLKVYSHTPTYNPTRLETPDGIALQMTDPRNAVGQADGERLIFWFRYISLGDIHMESMLVETATGKSKPRIRQPLTEERSKFLDEFVNKHNAGV
jgi:hypothetical protein